MGEERKARRDLPAVRKRVARPPAERFQELGRAHWGKEAAIGGRLLIQELSVCALRRSGEGRAEKRPELRRRARAGQGMTQMTQLEWFRRLRPEARPVLRPPADLQTRLQTQLPQPSSPRPGPDVFQSTDWHLAVPPVAVCLCQSVSPPPFISSNKGSRTKNASHNPKQMFSHPP